MTSLGIITFRDIVVSLMFWVTSHSGYVMPDQMPSVHFVSRTQLQSIVCAGRECPVIAFYHRERGIMIEDSFEKSMGLCELSILVHELVHFFQYSQEDTGEGGEASEQAIYDWTSREVESHRLQKLFLDQYNRRYRPQEIHYTYGFRREAQQGHFYARGCRRNQSEAMTSLAR